MMRNDNQEPLGWVAIIAILVGVAFATGLLLGFVGTLFGLPPSLMKGGIGATVGVVAAVLITGRRAAIARRKNH